MKILTFANSEERRMATGRVTLMAKGGALEKRSPSSTSRVGDTGIEPATPAV